MSAAAGGGLYEHITLSRIWDPSVESPGATIPPYSAVSLSQFWMPVHGAVTFLSVVALMLTWNDAVVRRRLIAGVLAYSALRIWSALYFIPEMATLQTMVANGSGGAALSEKLNAWRFWAALRQPLSLLALLCFLLALTSVRKR